MVRNSLQLVAIVVVTAIICIEPLNYEHPVRESEKRSRPRPRPPQQLQPRGGVAVLLGYSGGRCRRMVMVMTTTPDVRCFIMMSFATIATVFAATDTTRSDE